MVNFSASRVLKVLLVALVILVLAHVLALVSRLGFDHDHLLGLVPLFDLDKEANLPTWFSSVVLLAAGALSFVCGFVEGEGEDRLRRYWFGLAGIFVYMSADETARIHEIASQVIRRFFVVDGVFFHPWVIPFGIAALAIGLLYLRFLARLPAATAMFFTVGGVMYLGGAIGMEVLGAPFAAAEGYGSPVYAAIATVEELLEIAGIAVFVYGALSYLEQRRVRVTLTFGK